MVQLEGHFDGNKAACVSVCGVGVPSFLQQSPEIHSVTMNCNSKSMTPSKSSQTLPKIIEEGWRVNSVQSELDSCVLYSNAWDLMEMGRQPGAKRVNTGLGRTRLLGADNEERVGI